MRSTVTAVFAATIMLASHSARAAEAIEISKAWTVASDHKSADIPLYMTITNHANEEDALVRGRCDAAMFVEKHVVDHGEGAPAMRAVPALAIAANGDTVLKPDAPHVMLLQTARPLKDGDTFTCTMSFRKGGSVKVEVSVKPAT